MIPSDREALIRAKMAAVAEELIELGVARSGHCLVHFQHGMPGKVEWRLTGRIIETALIGESGTASFGGDE